MRGKTDNNNSRQPITPHSLSTMNNSSRQSQLGSTGLTLYLKSKAPTDISGTSHPTALEYIFSTSHRIFFTYRSYVGPQCKSTNFRRLKSYEASFLGPQWYETSDINNKGNWNIHKYMELDNMLQHNQWVKEVKREIKGIMRKFKWKYNIPKLVGHSKSSSRRHLQQ